MSVSAPTADADRNADIRADCNTYIDANRDAESCAHCNVYNDADSRANVRADILADACTGAYSFTSPTSTQALSSPICDTPCSNVPVL